VGRERIGKRWKRERERERERDAGQRTKDARNTYTAAGIKDRPRLSFTYGCAERIIQSNTITRALSYYFRNGNGFIKIQRGALAIVEKNLTVPAFFASIIRVTLRSTSVRSSFSFLSGRLWDKDDKDLNKYRYDAVSCSSQLQRFLRWEKTGLPLAPSSRLRSVLRRGIEIDRSTSLINWTWGEGEGGIGPTGRVERETEHEGRVLMRYVEVHFLLAG